LSGPEFLQLRKLIGEIDEIFEIRKFQNSAIKEKKKVLSFSRIARIAR
jgi:hypothetical protein